MKKIMLFSLIFVKTLLIFGAGVSASDEEKSEVSEVFINYIQEVFKDLDRVTVLNTNGSDVTADFIDTASKYYFTGDYQEIQNLISHEGLSVSYTDIKEIALTEDDYLNSANFTIMSNIRSKSVTEHFYVIATDANYGHTKDWVITLSGSYSYDVNTYRVTHTNSPSLSLSSAAWGAAFTPEIQSIRTSHSHSGSTARFTGSYTMLGLVGISVGSIPIGFKLNFGGHSHSFQDHPLQ